jgi:hypothetical protein
MKSCGDQPRGSRPPKMVEHVDRNAFERENPVFLGEWAIPVAVIRMYPIP